VKKFICVVSIIAIASVAGYSKFDKGKFAQDVAKDVAKALIDMSFGSGPNGPFTVKKTKEKDATLVIQNDTDRMIHVKAKGPTNKNFNVKSGKSESAIVKPGQYDFTAEAKGTSGCEGSTKLEGYNEYTWVFVIKK